MDWKAGDWVVFDLRLGQIKEIRDNGCASFSDGFIETFGMLFDRFRPLTLRNKAIMETLDILYRRLREIDGQSGFNYPDISSYFSALACEAIDGPDHKQMYDKAHDFVRDVGDYKPVIQGVRLFRPQRRAVAG